MQAGGKSGACGSSNYLLLCTENLFCQLGDCGLFAGKITKDIRKRTNTLTQNDERSQLVCTSRKKCK